MKINTVFKQTRLRLFIGLLFAFSGFCAFAGDGTSFDSPIEITSAGSLTCEPDGDNNPVYFAYKASQDGVIIIPTHSSFDYVTVYDADQTSIGGSYYDFAKCRVQKDVVYYIAWQANSGIAFSWSIEERAESLGDYCDNPIVAGASNTYQSSENWDVFYIYTAQKDGLLVLSDGAQNATVAVYSDCDGNNMYKDQTGELTVNITAGSTYIINWYSADSKNFAWTLKEQEAFAGATCANAGAISFLNDEFSETINGGKYYSYTPSVDEYVKLSDGSVTGTVSYTTQCDYFDYPEDISIEGELIAKLSAGTEYLFRYLTSEEATLHFRRVVVAGESCDEAIVMKEGSVSEYPLYDGYRYYKYIATKDAVVEIKCDELNKQVSAYNNCKDGLGFSSDTSHVYYLISQGDSMIVALACAIDDAFTWTLSSRDIKDGELCSKAITLQAGETKIDAYTYGLYYVYTAQKDASLQISSPDAQMIAGSGCGNDAVWGDSPSSSVKIDVQAGKDYYFLIQSDVATQLSVSETVHFAGESCDMPLVITDPKQMFDSLLYEADVPVKYYTVTPPKEGMLVIAPSSADTKDFAILVMDACDGNTVAVASDCDLKFVAQANKTYVIIWTNNNSSSLEWYLKLRDVADGERCDKPIVISQQGVQHFALSNQLDSVFYKYTVEYDGLLRLSDSSKYNTLEISSVCGGEATLEYGFIDLQVKKGDTYIIKWTNNGTTAFDWTLENRALYAGETCQNPIVLTNAGEVQYDYSNKLVSTYYTYTAKQDGLLIFTDSTAKNYVLIVDNCTDDTPEGYTSQYQLEVRKGKSYLFSWNNQANDNFKWTLAERAIVEGELCSKPKVINAQGAVAFNNSANLPTQYYAFTAQTTGVLILQDTSLTLAYSVLDACNGNYIASGYGSVKAVVTKGNTYIVEIYNYTGVDKVWQLSNRALYAGEVCSNAIGVKKNLTNTFAPASVLEQKYYTYTAEQDGVLDLQIEKDRYGFVGVLQSCDGDELGDNELGNLVIKAVKGTEYVIVWFAYDTIPFTWTLDNRAASANDFCDKPTITELVTNVGCVGSKYGSIDVSVSGGSGSYTYRWSNTSTKEDLFDIEPGIYKVTVTDGSLCAVTKEFEVKSAGVLTVTETVTNPQCSKDDGKIALTVGGGTSPYSYLWSDASTESELNNKVAGAYVVTVTDSKSCTAVKTIALNNATAPVISIEKQTNVQCGQNNGAISVVVVGGKEPYTYLWNDKANADATKEDRIGLSAGTYTLTVTDANGCSASKSAQVVKPIIEQPQISLVTVGSDGKNLVVWLREQTDAIKYYTIYRETEQAGTYDSVGTVNYKDLSVFHDKNADADEIAWRYKISATDNCGNETALSREYKTMHLQRLLGDKAQINLLWDSYEGTEFKTYIVYAKNEHDSLVELRRLPTSINRYTVSKPLANAKGYYVAIDLPTRIEPSKFKSDSGPFSQSMSNMAEASLVSVSSVDAVTFAVYPNPTTSLVTIGLPVDQIVRVKVFDNSGIQVLSLGAVQTVDFSKLAEGTYTVQVTTLQQSVIEQSVVKQ